MIDGLPRISVAVILLSLLVSGCGASDSPDASRSRAGTRSCAGPVSARALPDLQPVDAPKPKLPVEYRDITGETITIRDTSRVLALDTYGTLASTVYALGLGDRLVGRDISTGIPALKHLPVVTHNGHQLNAEAILALNPTAILTDYSIGPLEVQLQLRDVGIPIVIMSDERSRDQIGPQITAVAEALGVPAVGAQLVARVESEIAAADARVAAVAPPRVEDRHRMVFLYMRGTAGVYYWFGKGSGADDLIAALDGVDVASEVGLKGDRPLNAEGLARAAPSLFLMMTDGLRSVGGVDGLLKVPGVAETDAGVNRCVVDMSDFDILSFGPQFPATLTALTDAIYGTR